MIRKRWHAMGLAVGVGVATTFAVGASSGPDPIEFWTGELLSLVMRRPMLGTMYWRLTEGITVAVMALPGLVLALRVYAKAHPGLRYPAGCCRGCGYDLRGNTSGRCPECGAGLRSGGTARR